MLLKTLTRTHTHIHAQKRTHILAHTRAYRSMTEKSMDGETQKELIKRAFSEGYGRGAKRNDPRSGVCVCVCV